MQPRDVWHILCQENSVRIRCSEVEAESLRKGLYRSKKSFDLEMSLLYTDPSEMPHMILSMTYKDGIAHYKLTEEKKRSNSYELILDDEEISTDLGSTQDQEDYKD